jgi:ganglioside-induced differentiation-associated protein 1
VIIAPDKVTTTDVKDWKGLHLLHFQGSSCSQKVRLMLGELNLNWTSHPINLIKQENATPWFLGINPRGVVPVLINDGEVHVESNDIIEYLDQQYAEPGKSYFFDGDDSAIKEAKALLDLEDSLHMDLRLLSIVFGPLKIKSEKQINAQESNGKADSNRDHEVQWWRDKATNGISESEINTATNNFRQAFEQLDQRLENQLWLMGERISIADISWFVNLQRLVKLGYPLARHKSLHKYYQRISTRQAFRKDAKHQLSIIGSIIFAGLRLHNRIKGVRFHNHLKPATEAL